MPNRIIKESICTSEEIDGLSEPAEILFYRLMVNADDYGRFDCRPKLIASKCYPLKSIDIKRVQKLLDELSACGLIIVYSVEDRPYGQFKNWARHQQIRAKKAKFPGPEDGSVINCNQMQSNAPVIQSNPIQSESNPNPKKAPASPDRPQDVSEQVWNDWIALRKAKRATVSQTVIEVARNEALKADMAFEDFLRIWCARGSQGMEAAWIKPSERGQQLSYLERDELLKRKRYEEMTGRTHPDNLPKAEVVDAEFFDTTRRIA